MKSLPSSPKPTRAYARDKKDVARLKAAGLRDNQIYQLEKKETPGVFTMRKGEFLGVVDGMLAFGRTRRQIEPVVSLIHSWGAFVLDVETGRNSQTQAVSMFNDALDPPKPSPEYMALKRAEKRAERRKSNGVMPERDAMVIWRNPKLSVVEALDLMDGWTKSLAYEVLGTRGVPAGRRRTQATA
jgi:hypothetical protein